MMCRFDYLTIGDVVELSVQAHCGVCGECVEIKQDATYVGHCVYEETYDQFNLSNPIVCSCGKFFYRYLEKCDTGPGIDVRLFKRFVNEENYRS